MSQGQLEVKKRNDGCFAFTVFIDHPANASCSREGEHSGYNSEWLACFQGVGRGNMECPHAFTKIEGDYGICGGTRVCCLIQPTLQLKVRMEKILLKYS